MKKYTRSDMENFERDECGRLICPTGDYSQIRSFGERCIFGEWCSFGAGCRFDECCIFGDCCSFGECCRFGKWCGFGAWNSFGEWCNFGNGCSFENLKVQNGVYFACDRIGSKRRKTYFFRDGDGELYVRAGCWFSSLDEFVERVKEAHGGTKYEKEYLAAVELAKIVLEGQK